MKQYTLLKALSNEEENDNENNETKWQWKDNEK